MLCCTCRRHHVSGMDVQMDHKLRKSLKGRKAGVKGRERMRNTRDVSSIEQGLGNLSLTDNLCKFRQEQDNLSDID